jgi:predicted deacylase
MVVRAQMILLAAQGLPNDQIAARLNTRREVVSFHYGTSGVGPKVYVQASLHADELPGMLVAHHLRLRLALLEDQGRLKGEVVVVPVANPIGLAQALLHGPQGRFDLASGENFNRHYAALLAPVLQRVEGALGADEARNTVLIRAALRDAVAAVAEDTELASLRKTLLGLACDAEVVLAKQAHDLLQCVLRGRGDAELVALD